MRERSGRQDVTERKRPGGLARLASAANATNESGGEAEIAGGVGVRRGAATRSLRSARGAAHSAASRSEAFHPTESRREKAAIRPGWSLRPRFWLNHVQMSHTLGTREMGRDS